MTIYSSRGSVYWRKRQRSATLTGFARWVFYQYL